jgi:hypothetical protein
MNLMNLATGIRGRIGAAVGAGVAAIFLLACGAFLFFVLSTQQSIQAWRINHLPEMGAADLAAAATGDDVLITGRLADNEEIFSDGYVAYVRSRWEVTPPDEDDEDGKPHGSWESVERAVPDLTLMVGDTPVTILSDNSATLSGPLHEDLTRGDGHETAEYEGQSLPEGSERVRGLYNGDLTTVLGKKASTGDIVPDELFVGDRVAFVEHKKATAQAMRIAGLCMMGLAPVVLIGGVLAGLFGRQR